MIKQEDRQRRAAEWLEHLQAWKASGESLSAYARLHGLSLESAYQWRRVLRSRGLWHEEPSATSQAERAPVRFARVTVKGVSAVPGLRVHVHLTNGRRAEIELAEITQLAGVLGALEQSA